MHEGISDSLSRCSDVATTANTNTGIMKPEEVLSLGWVVKDTLVFVSTLKSGVPYSCNSHVIAT